MRFAFQDFSLDAIDIARRIDSLAELIMNGGDLIRLSEKIDYYWGLAEALGVRDQVDAIIQEKTGKEMEEAIERTLKGF